MRKNVWNFTLTSMAHKAARSRFFRCLICLLLICSMVLNLSPLRTKATVVGATVVAGTTAAGITGILFSMAMGVVFVDITADLIQAAGKSLTTHLQEYYADDEETTTTTLTPWLEGLEYTFGGSGDDGTGNGDDDNKMQLIPAEILGGLIDWAKRLINGGIEVEEEVEIVEGFASYNGHILPDYRSSSTFRNYMTEFPDSNCLVYLYNETYYFLMGNFDTITDFDIEGFTLSCGNGSVVTGRIAKMSLSGGFYNHGSFGGDLTCSYYSPIIWSNLIHGDLVTSETQTTIIPPDTYVGDIPVKVQDDTFQEDDLQLPYDDDQNSPYFDYSKIFTSDDYVSDLKSIEQQLYDGDITYEEYLEEIIGNDDKTETDPDTDTDTDTDTDSGNDDGNGDSSDSSGGTNLVDPPALDSGYVPHTLNLRDIFPFCIPFDIYAFFAVMAAEPEAPQFHWEIQDPAGNIYPIDIDLSSWDSVAAFFRRLQLLLFITGLAAATRKFIKW